jgi:hypothetical protein
VPPIALDPNEIFEAALKRDRKSPPDRRAVFLFRHLTARTAIRWRRMLAADWAPDDAFERLFGELRGQIAGWRNLTGPAGPPIAFDPAALEDVLTIAEAWELLATAASGLSLEQLRNFESRPPGGPAESAEGPARQPDATVARSGQPRPSQSSSIAPDASRGVATAAPTPAGSS